MLTKPKLLELNGHSRSVEVEVKVEPKYKGNVPKKTLDQYP
jgi:hypothetical protein